MAPPVKTFNKYVVHEDYATVFLYRKNGEEFECRVDLEDLDSLIKLNYHWHTMYDKVLDSYYAKTNITNRDENGKRKQRTLLMHKFIKDHKGKEYIDHINHNTLDNRKANLVIVPQRLNTKNRKNNKNNKSGERNVCWIESDNCWRVQLQVSGKNTKFGDFPFDKLEEAKSLARKLRKEIYGIEYEYATL